MKPFVDHLQILPVPFQNGRRQADGEHRPGGLGMATLAEELARRGWTARFEDMDYDKPMPEARLVEAFARGIGDGVLSAWDRSRFPIVLSRVCYGGLGVVDALGPRTGLVWVDAEAEYRTPSLLRRPPLDRTALAMVTGRARRDKQAVQPQRLSGEQTILVGGQRSDPRELRAAADDGIRRLAPGEVGRLPDLVAAARATQWYLHIDMCALPAAAAPAADDAAEDGVDPAELAAAVRMAFGPDWPLVVLACTRYDLNRDSGSATLSTLVDLIEAAVVAAGGEPKPRETRLASGGPSKQ